MGWSEWMPPVECAEKSTPKLYTQQVLHEDLPPLRKFIHVCYFFIHWHCLLLILVSLDVDPILSVLKYKTDLSLIMARRTYNLSCLKWCILQKGLIMAKGIITCHGKKDLSWQKGLIICHGKKDLSFVMAKRTYNLSWQKDL